MNFLANYFKYENGLTITGLTNELNVFYVLKCFQKLNKNLLVVTSSLYEANQMYNFLETYCYY